jgi:hypothetical protein
LHPRGSTTKGESGDDEPRPAVRLATIEDAEPIADLLADAFLDYEWSRWAVPADNRRERLRGLHLLYAGLLGAEVGGTWVTDDISSVVNLINNPPVCHAMTKVAFDYMSNNMALPVVCNILTRLYEEALDK